MEPPTQEQLIAHIAHQERVIEGLQRSVAMHARTVAELQARLDDMSARAAAPSEDDSDAAAEG